MSAVPVVEANLSLSKGIPAEDRSAPPVPANADTFGFISKECRDQLLWDARRIVGGSEDAEDVVQESLMRAWRNLQQYRGDAQIVTWLRAIVRNTAREWLRSRGSWVSVPLAGSGSDGEEVQVPELRDPGPGPEDHCARVEMARLLHEEISGLTAASRRAIEICALQEHSIRYAATMLNVDVVTIKSRLFRGRQWLHRGLCQRTGGRAYCHVP